MANLLKLLARRLAVLPLMILGITLLVFIILAQVNPDIAATGALGEGASITARQEWIQANGYNDPLWTRFFSYIAGLLHGDMGVYGGQQLSVADRVASAFPVTLQLTFLGLIVAVTGALILGVVAAIYRDRMPDQVIRVISILCLATPSFWLAVLMIQLFTLKLGWLPGSGKLPAFSADPVGYFKRMALPALALGVPVMGQLTRVVRTSMVEELDRGYVQTALAAGIPYPIVIARNVLRNALITPVTVLGLRVGYLMGGAVVIEIIFNLPGMGRAILEGVTSNYPYLVQGVTLVVALAFVVINIVVDLLYVLINPRIRSV
ncbi:ABC transporter permease [Stomatohabitans albus]|uniref:ABC transporter permease n=1 Tax=Stomatohabitans albus TaxID=3110766 RepID=UPI00300DBB9F